MMQTASVAFFSGRARSAPLRTFVTYATAFTNMADIAAAARGLCETSVRFTGAGPATENPPVDLDRMVRALAGRVLASAPRSAGLEMSDLIQAGNIGLLSAARTFRPEDGAPLAAYARFRIRGEMLDTVRRSTGRGAGKPVLVSASAGEAEKDIENRVPTPPELSPLGLLAARQRAAILHEEVERLPPRHRAVVRMRYASEYNLREIGAALRVNESRACQLHQNALGRLRRALSKRGVHWFSQLM
jgi:RNA polymerase sigma factor for flagellar operon FliA